MKCVMFGYSENDNFVQNDNFKNFSIIDFLKNDNMDVLNIENGLDYVNISTIIPNGFNHGVEITIEYKKGLGFFKKTVESQIFIEGHNADDFVIWFNQIKNNTLPSKNIYNPLHLY